MSPQEIAALLEGRMGLVVTLGEAEGLARYLHLLLQWNARMNLTAVRDPEGIVLRHFGESLFCARSLGVRQEASLLDFGSGAGFPGLVCALACPGLQVTLAESQGKKAAFLGEAGRVLGLPVAVHAGRVSDLSPGRRFTYVTLRAVDRMAKACGEAQHRLVLGGRLGVLTTNEALPAIEAAASLLAWEIPWPVPASEDRVLAIGTLPA